MLLLDCSCGLFVVLFGGVFEFRPEEGRRHFTLMAAIMTSSPE